jgi:hypothetical protein
MKEIALAVANYHDAHGSYPPAYLEGPNGRPWHSWRVLILHFLEQKQLYNAYNFAEPWNGPQNAKLLSMMPNVYLTPDQRPNPAHTTSYVVVTGSQTAFPAPRSLKADDIGDGTSNTLLAIEVADSGIPWMAPVDFHFDQMSFHVNDGSRRGPGSRLGGARVAYLDETIRHIPDDFPPERLRSILTANGGEPPLSGDQNGGPVEPTKALPGGEKSP